MVARRPCRHLHLIARRTPWRGPHSRCAVHLDTPSCLGRGVTAPRSSRLRWPRWRVLQRHQPSLGEVGNGGRAPRTVHHCGWACRRRHGEPPTRLPAGGNPCTAGGAIQGADQTRRRRDGASSYSSALTLRSAGSTTSHCSFDEARPSRLTGWRCACPSQRTVRSLPLDDGSETLTRLTPPAGRTPPGQIDTSGQPLFRPGPPPALLVWAAVFWAGECQAGGADILAAVPGGYGGMPLAGERGQ